MGEPSELAPPSQAARKTPKKQLITTLTRRGGGGEETLNINKCCAAHLLAAVQLIRLSLITVKTDCSSFLGGLLFVFLVWELGEGGR